MRVTAVVPRGGSKGSAGDDAAATVATDGGRRCSLPDAGATVAAENDGVSRG